MALTWAALISGSTNEARFNREAELRKLKLQKSSVVWRRGKTTEFGHRESGCTSFTTSAQLWVLDVEARSKARLLESETVWAAWYGHFRNRKLGCFQRKVDGLKGVGAGTKGSGHYR